MVPDVTDRAASVAGADPGSGASLDNRPLCVDLDGTLINTDLLVEGLLSVFSTRGVLPLLTLLTWSRAQLKMRVAQLAQLDPRDIPFNRELIDFLREQRWMGRRIVLVTAADRRAAQAVAQHLDLFDEVIASNGVQNLKGDAKAEELVRRFGRKGFDYIGNDRSDLPVWREANASGVVNAPASVARAARQVGNVFLEISDRPSPARMILKAMRPYQWVKNLLVFVPLVASRSFGDVKAFDDAFYIFASFCLVASGIYLINDLLDLSADRQHPRKRERPVASGALSLTTGVIAAAVLLAFGIVLGVLAEAVQFVLLYAAVSLAYSLALKEYPLLDVFMLAGLYTVRIVAGGVATEHPVTLWLLAFSGFTFLSLALVKRAAELGGSARSAEQLSVTRRGYQPEDRQLLVTFGVASAFASSVVLALFISTAAAMQAYRSPEVFWGVVPLILFWHCRLWLAAERGRMHDDPIIYAVRDWVSWLVGAAKIVLVLLASWAPAFW
jgi:4-hydroxybenzoate polyprenyltransferase/phosphoserine phosphatase